MKRESKKRKTSIAEIEAAGDRGLETSSSFTAGSMKSGAGRPVRRNKRGGEAIQKVNVDLTVSILAELDAIAALLNVSRQSVIKGFIKEGLDKHFLASKARLAGAG